MHGIVLVAFLAGSPQAPPPPPPPPPPMRAPRDPATIKKGTSIIKGHVFSADRRPLRRARIRAVGADPRDAVTTTTGLDGEFELRELPAGRYTLHATRSGYLPAQYGQRGYGEPGTPVDVGNAAAVEKIEFVMSRAGVVSGRIMDEAGDPAAGVDVRAMQLQFFRGRKRIVPVATSMLHVSTDDTGQYRLTGLPPGDYFIVGRLRDTWMSDEKEPQMLSYAPTFFPGAADASSAQRVRIASGQEAGAIDFTLVPVRAATLSGTALASDGTPLSGGRISLTQEIMGPAGGTMSMTGSAVIEADGSWKVRDVPPGEYLVRAMGTAGDRASELAVLPVTVHGADLSGLVVTGDPGEIIAGRVVTDTGEPLPASASRPSVATTPVSMEGGTFSTTPGQNDGVVGPDGRFSRKSMSGRVVLRMFSLPRGWFVRSIDIGGREVAGLAIDLHAGQPISNVTITVTSRLPSLTGQVNGGEAKSPTVLLFPQDPERWLEAAANQRTVRPDHAGTYRFDDVLPGEYFVIALESFEQWQMNDPEFLSAQAKGAQRVTIGDQPATLDLKVVR